MTRGTLVLVALVGLACAGLAPAEPVEAPEPAEAPPPAETSASDAEAPASADSASDPSTDPEEPDMTADHRERVQTWAAEQYDTPADRVRVSSLGTATGHPAYVVRIGEPRQPPEREVPVVLLDGERPLVGRSGWRVFLEHEGRDDAEEVAAAWLALYRGEAQEPYGRHRAYKKKQRLPDPVWKGDQLVVHYSGHRGKPTVARLAIDANDTVEVVSQKPWVPSPF